MNEQTLRKSFEERLNSLQTPADARPAIKTEWSPGIVISVRKRDWLGVQLLDRLLVIERRNVPESLRQPNTYVMVGIGNHRPIIKYRSEFIDG